MDLRKLLFGLGIVLSLGGPVLWFIKGANTGWTKTRVMETLVDPVTGIEAPVWKDKFLPGVDFLIGADTVGMILIVGSFIGRKKQT